MSTTTLVNRLPMILAPDTGVHEKCARCGGKCCSYFALQIDSPRTWEDFDDIRWYVAHRGVEVFREGRRWFLQVNTVCQHLEDQGLCGIYEQRPKICRDHKVVGCEFENDEPLGYSVHFQKPQEVAEYMSRRWPKGAPEKKRKPRRALPKALRRRG